jgi:hypothetical protein
MQIQSGAGGSGSGAFQTVITDSGVSNTTTVVTITAGTFRNNNIITVLGTSATVTANASSLAAGSQVWIEFDPTSQVRMLVSNANVTQANLSLSNITLGSPTASGFTSNRIPIATCTGGAVADQWTACTDVRTPFATGKINAGTGIQVTTESDGGRTVTATGMSKDGAFLTSGGLCYLPSLDLMQATIPSAAGYTQINNGVTATISTNGSGTCTHRQYNVNGDSADVINSGEFISIGANTNHIVVFSCEALNFRGLTDGSTGGFNSSACYTGFRESSTGKRVGIGITTRNSAALGTPTFGIVISKYTSEGPPPVATHFVATYAGTGGTKMIFRLRVDGTRIFADYSENGGEDWREIYRQLYTTDFTTAPDQFGDWASPPALFGFPTNMFIFSRSTN